MTKPTDAEILNEAVEIVRAAGIDCNGWMMDAMLLADEATGYACWLYALTDDGSPMAIVTDVNVYATPTAAACWLQDMAVEMALARQDEEANQDLESRGNPRISF